jgi:hypothetical protein
MCESSFFVRVVNCCYQSIDVISLLLSFILLTLQELTVENQAVKTREITLTCDEMIALLVSFMEYKWTRKPLDRDFDTGSVPFSLTNTFVFIFL